MSIQEILETIASGFSQFSFFYVIDIILTAVLIYNLIVLTKGTRAFQVLKGVAIIFVVTVVCALFDLTVINWLLNSLLMSGLIIIIVLFQPELRRALEHIGRGAVIDKARDSLGESAENIINEIHRAVLSLSKRRVGALIVIEQKTGLEDIVSTGTRIEGIISEQLLENIFEPKTPLHDGAAILRAGTIVAASCFLPLFDDTTVAKELGTRHRAGLGVSAISDSVTIIVSEETGVISIAQNGKLTRYIDSKALLDSLKSIYLAERTGVFGWLKRRSTDGRN
ncbi:MAG: diadenylate cyclase CdaA [Clostridia bacterium]|nr:diadenylate cyclase CdaA [Clostridia bacterium]